MTNELIKIETNEQGQKLVSGRELHEALKVQQDFTDWIKKQLNNVDAIEGEESTLLKGKTSEQGGRPTTEYILTMDIAKEICMCVGVSPRTNEETKRLSKQVRKYFIECEKKLQSQTPQLSDRDNAILMVMNSTSDIERVESLKHFESVVTKPLLATIEEQKPCVDYVDAVLSQKDSILVRQVCKIAYTKNQIEIGEKKLYSLLRHWGWICKNSTEPTQKALNSDYVEIESKIIHTAYGDREVYTTMIKPKGQVYIVQKLATMTIQEVNEIHKSITKTSKF